MMHTQQKPEAEADDVTDDLIILMCVYLVDFMVNKTEWEVQEITVSLGRLVKVQKNQIMHDVCIGSLFQFWWMPYLIFWNLPNHIKRTNRDSC